MQIVSVGIGANNKITSSKIVNKQNNNNKIAINSYISRNNNPVSFKGWWLEDMIYYFPKKKRNET